MTIKLYSASFTGVDGNSIGIFAIGDSFVCGSDIAGLKYDGKVKKNDDGSYQGTIKLTVPSGVSLITGMTATSDQELSIPFFLPESFDDGKTIVRIETPTGPINAIFYFLRDLGK